MQYGIIYNSDSIHWSCYRDKFHQNFEIPTENLNIFCITIWGNTIKMIPINFVHSNYNKGVNKLLNVWSRENGMGNKEKKINKSRQYSKKKMISLCSKVQSD